MMKIKFILGSKLLLILFFILILSPLFINAQPTPVTGGNPPPVTGGNPSQNIITIPNPFKCPDGGCSISAFINTIIRNILLPIGGTVAVIMIMYAGFLYVTARGSASKIEEAHRALLYAVIGSAILLGAFVISEVIEGTINQFKR